MLNSPVLAHDGPDSEALLSACRPPAQVCDECPEVELHTETVTLHVDIEPGMENGTIIPLAEEGDPHPDGDPGDLLLVLVQAQPHAVFTRDRSNLRANLQISLVDALAGFRHELEHLDGHKVRACYIVSLTPHRLSLAPGTAAAL